LRAAGSPPLLGPGLGLDRLNLRGEPLHLLAERASGPAPSSLPASGPVGRVPWPRPPSRSLRSAMGFFQPGGRGGGSFSGSITTIAPRRGHRPSSRSPPAPTRPSSFFGDQGPQFRLARRGRVLADAPRSSAGPPSNWVSKHARLGLVGLIAVFPPAFLVAEASLPLTDCTCSVIQSGVIGSAGRGRPCVPKAK